MGDEQIAGLIRVHLGRYGEARMIDVYKLLHQATFGPGHLIANKKAAREYLEMEMGQLRPAAQPLVENVHPEGALVRLHLRPYLSYTTQAKPLLDALVRSAEATAGDPAALAALMAARWAMFAVLVSADPALAERFDRREIQLWGTARERESWPACSHSPEFNAAYKPHYRVLTAGEAEALCQRIGAPFEVV